MDKTITIAKAKKMDRYYDKPEVKMFGNKTFVVYQEDNDIFLSVYEKGKVTKLKNVSDSYYDLCEPELFISKDGILHIAWCDETPSLSYIRYRNYDFKTDKLSEVFELGSLVCDNIEDLRITVDDSGNVFVVFMYWPEAKLVSICKYGDDIERKIFDKRGKHGDIAVDKDHVYVVWQSKKGSGYIIALQKKDNLLSGGWHGVEVIDKGLVQRPRISLTGEILHVIYHVGEDPHRQIFYKSSKDKYKKKIEVSSGKHGFGYIDISAYDADNIIVSMRKNREICYNQMTNGKWSGSKVLLRMQPKKQSVDLDKKKFSLVFVNNGGEEIILKQVGDLSEIEPFVEIPVEPPVIEPPVDLGGIPVDEIDLDDEGDPEPDPEPVPEPEKSIGEIISFQRKFPFFRINIKKLLKEIDIVALLKEIDVVALLKKIFKKK